MSQGVGSTISRFARWRGRAALAAAGALGMTVAVQAPASAATTVITTNPYSGSGNDISYPQCNIASDSFSGPSFYVIGVGGGRPFTSNSCARTEWSSAVAGGGTNLSVYFNTGYAGAYARDISATCVNEVANGPFTGLKGHTLSNAQQAWEIGCSEALYATTVIPAATPKMYWADIETGNSWSTNASLNQYTIDGISFEMAQHGGGGIYSSPGMWASITGSSGWSPPSPDNVISANWVTGAGSSCATTFGASPTWLWQSGTTTLYGDTVDVDTAC